jgi:hypothetical protein
MNNFRNILEYQEDLAINKSNIGISIYQLLEGEHEKDRVYDI